MPKTKDCASEKKRLHEFRVNKVLKVNTFETMKVRLKTKASTLIQ